MPTIVSTASNPGRYVEYEHLPNGLHRIKRSVQINGGAGVMQKRGLVTSLGVTTIVTDDELKFLKTNSAFLRHIDAGFLKIVTGNPRLVDGNSVAKDMEPRDGASPLMVQDFPDKKAPVNQTSAVNDLPKAPRLSKKFA